MARFFILVAVAIAVGCLTYLLRRRNRLAAHRRQFQADHHCVELRAVPNLLPYGLENLIGPLAFKGPDLDHFITTAYDKHGNTHRLSGLAEIILTSEPQNIQTVLAFKVKDYVAGKNRKDQLGPLLGNGIFTSDGEAWEHYRAMIRPQFSRAQISDLNAVERYLQRVLKALSTDASGWTSEVDLFKAFRRFTLDSATEFLFGKSAEALLGGVTEMSLTPEDNPPDHRVPWLGLMAAIRREIYGHGEMGFREAMDVGVQDTVERQTLATLFGLLGRKRFRAARGVVHNYLDHYIQWALQSGQEKTNGSLPIDRRYSLLNELLAETQDPIDIRDQLLHVLIGAMDTTAALLGWVFFLMPRHPEVYSKLRAEILSTLGSEDSAEEITFEKLKSVQYLQFVLKETLRLYPPVSMNYRVAANDTVLPLGGGPDGQQPIAVMKDTLVTWSIYHMHRRKDIWGPDALEFKPERWENLKSGWFFLPFNGGPRNCIGQQYALTEAGFVIARICQRFDAIESTDYQEKYEKAVGLVMYPGRGVRVRLHRSSST